ncbi:MAG: extracellular solute-binding protein [Spirochaetaceae bacterium]|jgi:microcin C transport system substrate-binding protein|nr:extracellular solute-binding protein [Spirochaetaceae bacterium]
MKKHLFFLLIVVSTLPVVAQIPKTVTATAISLRGEPLYPEGFTHFAYVNPNAPKGGSIVLDASPDTTYDNFNRYALRGSVSAGSEYFYDTLMCGSGDEFFTYYPLIAERVEYATDYSFIIFSINRAARDQDGFPLTAEDVKFSFDTFMTQGVPQFRIYYEGISATVLDTYRVRFDLGSSGDKEKMLELCLLTIIPKRFWQNRNFSEPLMTPPVGTGPYRVSDYKMGQSVTVERVKNYWAADLPVNKGRLNFDTIHYDYYRDSTVSFEAFKSGAYDFREEMNAMNWATQYTGKLFTSGQIIKREIPHDIPRPMQCFVFNTERPVFQDRRVRQALNYFMDFEWMNKNLFYGQYTRTRSFFQNTSYEAKGLPTIGEIAVLNPIRDKIPPEVFTTEYQPPVTDGSGTITAQARRALALLSAAGWDLKGGKMIQRSTGTPMQFEILIYDSSDERIVIPLQRNLERYGISINIRLIDASQYLNRLRSRDYDFITYTFSAMAYPDSSLVFPWHSAYLESTYNAAGVQDPAIDYLIEGILTLQEEKDAEALLTWGHALDRVLTWNFYVIPQWYLSKFRIAYKDKFGIPNRRPRYEIGVDTWWIK